MDLAYVVKLARGNSVVNYLLAQQEQFDRTVDTRGMNTEDSEETVRAFLTKITKKIHPTKFGSTKEPISQERSENIAKLKENKFTLRWVRLWMHLLNVHYDPRKIYFTVTWKVVEAVTFTNCLNSSQPKLQKKKCSIDMIPKYVENSEKFCPFCTAGQYENIKFQN